MRRAADLTDRALPADARGYATAATALIEADTGLLAAARARLGAARRPPGHRLGRPRGRLARRATRPGRRTTRRPGRPPGCSTGLHHITARWAAYDGGTAAHRRGHPRRSCPPPPGAP